MSRDVHQFRDLFIANVGVDESQRGRLAVLGVFLRYWVVVVARFTRPQFQEFTRTIQIFVYVLLTAAAILNDSRTYRPQLHELNTS